MTVYAPSDHVSITIPGGCGQAHTRPEDLPKGDKFAVNCPACEPKIIAMRTGWAHTVDGVHLTPDELAEVKAAEEKAARQQAKTWGSPTALGDALKQAIGQIAAPPAAGPSLLAQIAAMTPEEKAALRGLLDDEPADDAASATQPVPVKRARSKKDVAEPVAA